MEVTLALLADAANVSQEGKLNVLGAFSTIFASRFPARHPQLQVVLEIDASVSEAETPRQLEIRLLGNDGQIYGTLTAQFQVPRPPQPGVRINMGMVLPINDAVFLAEGPYVFDVMIDGHSKKQIPLTVTQVPGESEDDGDQG